MHESTGRNVNSTSLLLSNSNRALNHNPSKLTRPPLQQENAAKKLKVGHGNGVKPTVDGNSTAVRSEFIRALQFDFE